MSSWIIAEPSNGLKLIAKEDGVWLCTDASITLTDPYDLYQFQPRGRLGRLLPTLIPQLLEMGIASEQDSGFQIGYRDFSNLKEDHDIDAFDRLVPWTPWVLQLETQGSPGMENFRYVYRFFAGQQVVYPERLGCFVRRFEKVYQLDRQSYGLVEAIEMFNALPAEQKSGGSAFIRFAEVKGLAEEVGADLDRFLLTEKVVVPSEIAVDIIAEDEGRVSFAPKIDGVPEDGLRRAFFAFDDVQEVYSLDDTNGGRIRVVLNEAQREVLRRMQRVRHLGGAQKAQVLRDPVCVFDGVAEGVRFGPRVEGIGDFPFVARPFLQRSSTGIFDDPESAAAERPEHRTFSAGITIKPPDGPEEQVYFTSREQLYEFRHCVTAARESGAAVVEFQGKSILVDTSLVRGMDELIARVTPSAASTEQTGDPRRYVLIYTNENQLEYAEKQVVPAASRERGPGLPNSLKPGTLKTHQYKGLEWLQWCFLSGRKGCLLADDMGLGKTLQVLSFLAWFIERGDEIMAPSSKNPDEKPWRPILIVTPLSLLENEIWIDDMRKFFHGDGAVFDPWIPLHGNRLKAFRRKAGAETVIGEPVLDTAQFSDFRLILTNYETVVNYQHSFAGMGKGWSVVVTDEAQEYKTSSTKVSHALKSLDPEFRIACTGTPVETRLMDLWNIVDFLQPGQLLGSAQEFSKTYEQPLQAGETETLTSVASRLRQRLRFGEEDAHILRRDKSNTLPDLPAKHEHVLECDLSARQRDWHIDLVARARSGGPENHPFSLLDQLWKVYQHPMLVPRYEPLSYREAVEQCPKLRRVLECLHDIRRKSEKALIFTRRLNMQQILASVIREEFKIDVDMVNGAECRKGNAHNVRTNRCEMVQRFREKPGFNVLIVSPDVAGLGLTLVEANHVIHYGRWWNPAKESQATDRVYRIGQTQDVHVYYPIAKDPFGEFVTFDEKLDALIRRRRLMAAEFLAPMPAEDQLQQELWGEVMNDPKPSGGVQAITDDYVRILPWDRFEALVALIEEKRGSRVLLTPRAGDDKADVLALYGKELRLIQCKHTAWGASIDVEAVAEVVTALELYRNRYLRSVSHGYALHPIVTTNGTFTNAAQSYANDRDVELISHRELCVMLDRYTCTPGEVEAMEARRLQSMRDLRAAIERLGPGNEP